MSGAIPMRKHRRLSARAHEFPDPHPTHPGGIRRDPCLVAPDPAQAGQDSGFPHLPLPEKKEEKQYVLVGTVWLLVLPKLLALVYQVNLNNLYNTYSFN